MPTAHPTRPELHLGKLKVRHDRRTLRLCNYRLPTLPPPPASVDYSGAVSPWLMLRNDACGDCTVAAALHLSMLWDALSGRPAFVPGDDSAISAYSAITGYNPTTGANDNGAVEIDVLNYWRNVGIGGKTIAAYAAVNWLREDRLQQAIFAFKGVYTGVSLPLSAQGQVGGVWDVVDPSLSGDSAPGSWGGHALPAVSYSQADGTYKFITWGAVQTATSAWVKAYVEECYACASAEQLDPNEGKSPDGYDLATLAADLAQVS